jgi:sulfoxide reductase heme-binding subunit YedZ
VIVDYIVLGSVWEGTMATGGQAHGSADGWLEGPRLVGASTALIAAACLGVAWWTAGDVDGVRLSVRLTARTSAALFCLAFSAAALYALAPSPWTAWQRRNRRYLGLSFAASHALHALAIAAYAYTDPVMFKAYMTAFMYVFGGIGYAFILAMTATSFDRTAAMIGPRAWRILHTVGAWYIWISFLNAFGMRAMADPSYWPLVTLVLAAMVVRLTSAIAARRVG